MDRYDRQVRLIGREKQVALLGKVVTVVGLGGTGGAVVELLARSGIKLRLIDWDAVEVDNLHRQLLFSEEDVGRPKAEVAAEKLSSVEIDVFCERLEKENADELLEGDLVVDCTDNLESRHLINEVCIRKNIPWVYTGASKMEGMVAVFEGRPCLRCMLTPGKGEGMGSCEAVLGPVPGAVGAIAATEAIKYLIGKGNAGVLYHYKFDNPRLDITEIPARKGCEVCG